MGAKTFIPKSSQTNRNFPMQILKIMQEKNISNYIHYKHELNDIKYVLKSQQVQALL